MTVVSGFLLTPSGMTWPQLVSQMISIPRLPPTSIPVIATAPSVKMRMGVVLYAIFFER